MENSNKLQPKKHIVVFSHGFGVQKDDRGLLSSIAEALPEVESVLFDYFKVDEIEKTLTTCPFSVQIKKLKQIIAELRLANPEAVIDLVCHSQGTIIAALARPEGIRKVILLAPSFDLGIERTLTRYQFNPEAVINLEGVSKLPALDGLTRVVPAQYWQERREVKPFSEYNALVEKAEVVAIKASQDEIQPKVDLKELSPKIKLISLAGDHGFSGLARKPLINFIRELLLD